MEGWWKEGYTSDEYNCTAEELAAVALYSVGSFLSEFREDLDAIAEPNLVRSIIKFCSPISNKLHMLVFCTVAVRYMSVANWAKCLVQMRFIG